MSYTKQNFKKGDTLTADHLNNIENGIINLEEDINFTVPQIFNNMPYKKQLGEQIKILCFGSSWFMNSWWYLNKIINNLGINAKIHGYYMGGSKFDEWISLYNGDLTPLNKSRDKCFASSENGADYTLEYKTREYTSEIITGYHTSWYNDITSEDWDIIIFQQGARQSPKWKYWQNYNEVVSIIKRHCNPNTVIGFNNTWTPAINSDELPSNTDNLASMSLEGQKLWQQLNWDNCKKMMNLSGINLVAPNGAMMYTMRRDTTLNTTDEDLAHDGLHPNNGLPMFGLACTLYEACIAPFYGIPVKNCTWLPDQNNQRAQVSSTYMGITEEQAQTIFKYVRLSLSNRFEFNEPLVEITE